MSNSKLAIFLLTITLYACSDHADHMHDQSMQGQMPSLARNSANKLFMVYGNGDSILYSSLKDSNFSTPALAGVLPHLAASHSRGPQVAATSNGLAVIACNHEGDIFSYQMDAQGNWSPAVRVNDVDTVAKEGLMSLAADGENLFAVWLDMRSKYNQVYGAKSNDGGKTWSKNMLVYASPDTTVCECCKPSVAVKGNNVYVMFRNWIDGNRDMYLVRSTDGGNTFGQAEKLGKGTWALDGCPVDGGGLVVNSNGNVETIWRRENNIYTCEPGSAEKQIGQGKSCTISAAGDKNVYAWTENGEVVCILPDGKKEVLGKGKLPALKAIDNKKIICVWQQDKEIRHASLLLP